MAFTGNVIAPAPITITIDTAADLSAKDGYACKISADNTIALAEAATTPVFPIIEGNDGSTTVTDNTIAVGGATDFKLGGTVAVGDKLTATTAGAWIATTTDTNNYGGIALKAGVTGDLIPGLVMQGMIAG